MCQVSEMRIQDEISGIKTAVNHDVNTRPTPTLARVLMAPVSVLYWIWSMLGVMIAAILVTLTCFDERSKAVRLRAIRFSRIWPRLSLRPFELLGIWKVRFTGEEAGRAKEPCVYVANHSSHLDIVLALAANINFMFVSKRSVFFVPGYGWGLAARGDVGLERGDAGSARAMLRVCKEKLAAGGSILIFPEGTRSSDGRLIPFKDGAFVLAKMAKVPVVPIAIHGTSKASPARRFWLGAPATLHFEVLEAIPANEIASMSASEISARVRTQIATALGQGPVSEAENAPALS